MKKVWAVICENEYGTSHEILCGSEDLANQVCALMQAAADDGTEPLQEYFYGHYFVQESLVAEGPAEVAKAWTLHEQMKKDTDELPPGWGERLKMLLGGNR